MVWVIPSTDQGGVPKPSSFFVMIQRAWTSFGGCFVYSLIFFCLTQNFGVKPVCPSCTLYHDGGHDHFGSEIFTFEFYGDQFALDIVNNRAPCEQHNGAN